LYHTIVRRRARGVFERLNRGDWPSLMASFAKDVYHAFPGEHALGGQRHSREALGDWFERLFRLFPHPDFDVRHVASRGWPWNTWVSVEWIDHVTPREGEPYISEGTHWMHLRWGRVTEIHAYLDTQRVAEACRQMAAAGIEEADAEPIVG
jgi:ketosteroid isomerase-like protein